MQMAFVASVGATVYQQKTLRTWTRMPLLFQILVYVKCGVGQLT